MSGRDEGGNVKGKSRSRSRVQFPVGRLYRLLPAGDKKRKRKREESYAIYIYKVLKQVHPDTGISSKSMSIMNIFVNHMFERIAAEASRLAHYHKRSIIPSREIQTAVHFLLPDQLAKQADSEGIKALTKINGGQKRGSVPHGMTVDLNEAGAFKCYCPDKQGAHHSSLEAIHGGKVKGKSRSRSRVQFPVGRLYRLLPAGDKKRKRKRKESFAIYIYKVLKQVHPDTGISSKAMSIMNILVNHMFERIAAEASRLAHYHKRSIIPSREIQTAVHFLLPDQLAKQADSEGIKALTKFVSSDSTCQLSLLSKALLRATLVFPSGLDISLQS
ncbi:uncharacterized protein LOC143275799 [Babylonia areolata]|uniref:uncharacterized protein LOC143275799 n=1 Tax=Babylonia areolata TaxID=304850 RepID=UPI003FD606FF